MTKTELRSLYKKQRMQLTAAELSAYNAAILASLRAQDWSQMKYVHTFLPIIQHNEPDMWAFVDFLRLHFPSVQLVVSRSNPHDYSMDNFLLREGVTLKKNAWGIVEPVDGEPVDEQLIDAVIIPLLIADKKGNRIGYGKGFYDRFLAKCRVDCLKIGVAYFEPIDEITDIGPFDIPLDWLLTPDTIHRF